MCTLTGSAIGQTRQNRTAASMISRNFLKQQQLLCCTVLTLQLAYACKKHHMMRLSWHVNNWSFDTTRSTPYGYAYIYAYSTPLQLKENSYHLNRSPVCGTMAYTQVARPHVLLAESYGIHDGMRLSTAHVSLYVLERCTIRHWPWQEEDCLPHL